MFQLTLSAPAVAQDPVPPAESLEKAFKPQKQFSPYAGRNFPTQVYWGDTHLHTGLATAAENNFFGKHAGAEPGPKRWEHPMAKVGDKEYTGWSMVASGYAGV